MDDKLFEVMRMALELAITGIGALMLMTLKDVVGSIKELNIKIAVICEQVSSHEKRIDRLEKQ